MRKPWSTWGYDFIKNKAEIEDNNIRGLLHYLFLLREQTLVTT
jgi:hypothetical protein